MASCSCLASFGGNLAGANTPFQVVTVTPGMPSSLMVGTSGNAAERVLPVTANARNFPALICAIAEGKVDLLDRAPGIGRKTAERIILELKDKMRLINKGGSGKAMAAIEADDDVYDALRSLGYSQNQARQAVGKIDPKLKDVGERLRDALKKMKS